MAIDKDLLIEYVNACMKEAEDARQARESQWDELWQVYRNQQDYSHKADWQSKCFIPKLSSYVDRATAILKRALIGTRQFFDVQSASEPEKVPVVKELTRFWLERAQFVTKFVEALKVALITGICVQKYYWDVTVKKVRRFERREELDANGIPYVAEGWKVVEELDSRLAIKNVDPYNIYLDPCATDLSLRDSRYIIERVEVDLAELKQRAEDEKDIPEEHRIWDAREIARIEEDFREKQKHLSELSRKGMLPSNNTFRSKVTILEFWGDIIDRDGKIVERNIVCAIANDRYVVRKVQQNPFWHEKPPYVLVVPKPYPYRLYGQSLIEGSVRMQYTMNNIVNLQVDNLSFSIMKMFRADPWQIENSESLFDLYPGKVVVGPAGSFEEIRMGEVPTQSFTELALFDREMQANTSVTDPIMGMPATKGRQTKGEVEIKTSMSMSHFDSISYDIEYLAVTQIVEMAYSLIFQFMDWDAPYIRKIVGDLGLHIERLSPEERRDLIAGNFVFQGSGLSLMVTREEKISKLFQLLQLMMQVEGVAAKYDPMKIVDKIVELLGVGNVEQFQREMGAMPGLVGQNPAAAAMVMQQLQGGARGQGQAAGGREGNAGVGPAGPFGAVQPGGGQPVVP